jgi:hypothetical protein
MTPPARPGAAILALASAALIGGCTSTAPPAAGPAAPAAPAAPLLATSVSTAAGTWAVAVMGGSAATHNNFWQLFTRPAGSSRWKLATPPGVADNGGLVMADAGDRSLITGFRPSQYLTYTPLAVTTSGGRAWSPAGPLDAALADVPDALAAAPGTGALLALLADGTARQSAPGYTAWTTLASRRSLAATPPGRHCGLQNLTAAAFSPAGTALLAGTCTHPGIAGIFASRNGTMTAAGPVLPAALARQPVTVLRLTRTAATTVALLAAGTGRAASLLAAWSADSGEHWTLSPLYALHDQKVTSASIGASGTAAIVLAGGHGETLTGPSASWRPAPPLPPGTATLAPGPAGGLDALAARRTTLTVWRLMPGSATWTRTQAISVPVQFGTSG